MIQSRFCQQLVMFTGAFVMASGAFAIGAESLDELLAAARADDVEKINALIAASPTLIDGTDRRGDTPLFAAVESMQLDAAKTLLDAGASVDGKFRRDWQLLHAVAFFGDGGKVAPERRKAIAALLIEHGADVRSADLDGVTALHVAAMKARMELLGLFVSAKADVNAKEGRERTPLHFAAVFGHPEIIAWLVKHGANVSAHDRAGLTPLHTAVERFNKESAVALITAGADPNAKDDNRRTPLHITAIAGRSGTKVDKVMADMATVLLTNGADPKAWDDANWITLQYAKKNGRVKLAAVLEKFSSK